MMFNDYNFNHIPDKEKIALKMIYEEYLAAKKKFPPFRSAHEAYGIILEEIDEFWHLVKNHDKPWSGPEAMKKEIQAVGAMALRFIIDM